MSRTDATDGAGRRPGDHRYRHLRGPRLDEGESDLEERRKVATAEGRLGGIEGVDLVFRCLRDKHADALPLTRITTRSTWACPP